jgi:hypothetical protein
MANKNSKRRKAEQHKAQKAIGFSKPVYKKKANPFPNPNKDEDMNLTRQREIFYGK